MGYVMGLIRVAAIFAVDIEDVTWPCGDKKFDFLMLKNISRVSEANELNIFLHISNNEILTNFTLISNSAIFICNHDSKSDLFTCENYCKHFNVTKVWQTLKKETCLNGAQFRGENEFILKG